MDAVAQRNRQCRTNRSIAAADDARQFATPYDDEPDYMAMYHERVDDWLADPDNTESIGEMLGSDSIGAPLLRALICGIDDRISGIKLAARAAELAYEPICSDIDYEARLAADALDCMRRYGRVE